MDERHIIGIKGDGLLSSKFTTKSKNFIKCVDDIVDSYFALKTMLKKETFI